MIAPAFKRSVAGTSRPVLAFAGVRGGAARLGFAVCAVVLALSGQSRAASGVPRATEHYLQYGATFVTELLGASGSVCPPNPKAPCILGSGVGLAVRIGYRTRGPFYVGGAYEFARLQSSNLLRLAILQQLRGEARYYLLEDTRFTPYFAAAAGGILYGNEWSADTGGITAFLGAGIEYQISQTAVFGATIG